MRTASRGEFAPASTHASATYTHHRLDFLVGAGIVDHYQQVHVLLGIEQAGIHIILVTAKVEHAFTLDQIKP
jgi:hypothetical protein